MNTMQCLSVLEVKVQKPTWKKTTRVSLMVRSHVPSPLFFVEEMMPPSASIEDLIQHGLHALRETLQQDKELNVNNTSIGIVGPRSESEEKPVVAGAFRILENNAVEPFLKTMIPKATDTAAPTSAALPQGGGDSDVQMSE